MLYLHILPETYVNTCIGHKTFIFTKLLHHSPLNLRPGIPYNPIERMLNSCTESLWPLLGVILNYQLEGFIKVLKLVERCNCNVILHFRCDIRRIYNGLITLVNINYKDSTQLSKSSHQVSFTCTGTSVNKSKSFLVSFWIHIYYLHQFTTFFLHIL